jgi:hypothetical protein
MRIFASIVVEINMSFVCRLVSVGSCCGLGGGVKDKM